MPFGCGEVGVVPVRAGQHGYGMACAGRRVVESVDA